MQKNVIISALVAAGLLAGGAAYKVMVEPGANINGNNLNTVVNATQNTNTNINIADWKEYTFDELGISMKLPFQKDQVTTRYFECDNSNGCDEAGYIFSGNLIENGKVKYSFLGSTSKNWSPGTDAVIQYFYDFSVKDESTLNVEKDNYTIHVIKRVETENQQVAYIFDPNRDYYAPIDESLVESGLEKKYEHNPEQYAAVVKLPGSTKFKAMLMLFQVEDLSLDEFIAAVGTIRDL